MVAAALVAAGAVALLAGAVLFLLFREMTRRERTWERRYTALEAERRDLVNRVMFMADRPYEYPVEQAGQLPDEPFVDDELDLPIGDSFTEFEVPVTYVEPPLSPAGRV